MTNQSGPKGNDPKPPNVLFIMTDSQRSDTIAALGNRNIYTPNLDRLVRRGLSFDRAYTPCPVCVPARYIIRTGCEPPTTLSFGNSPSKTVPGLAATMEERCGEFLARRMRRLGYRSFGFGKFHAMPWDEDLGFDVIQQVGDLYATPERRQRDGYASWIAKEHPEYNFIESLMGERSEMFYVPQMRPMPAEVTSEWWIADRAVAQIQETDNRPYFGFISFIAPHPPFAPPIPFNRMYDPERMPAPVGGDIETDYMDDNIPTMTHALWAEAISPLHARILKARYYGMISHMDHCLGRILDAVEARSDADNTLIVFCTDHGDHLGDHHAWHIGSFFETDCHIPFLVSWPGHLAANQRRKELVALTDLFGIATHAAGAPDPRRGVDILAMLNGQAKPRDAVYGCIGTPGGRFKLMVRDTRHKYIFMSNGGREQLFDLDEDPYELRNLATDRPDIVKAHRDRAVTYCQVPGAAKALENGDLRALEFKTTPPRRICQFDASRGVTGFPKHPSDLLRNFKL